MSTINLFLHDNSTVSTDMENYDPNALLNNLLDPKIIVIAVGNSVINKSMIKMISPQHSVDKVWTTPIKVSLHDGLVGQTEDMNFNSITLAEQLNDYTTSMIVIGDLIIAKNFIRMVTPIYAE